MLPKLSRQVCGSIVVCIGEMALILQVLWIYSIGESSQFPRFYAGVWGGFVLTITGSVAKSRIPLKGSDSLALFGAVVSFLMFCEALFNTALSFSFEKDSSTKCLAVVCTLLPAAGFVGSLRLRSLLIKFDTRSVISAGEDVPNVQEIEIRSSAVSPRSADIPSMEERPPSYEALCSQIDTNEFDNDLEKCIIDK